MWLGFGLMGGLSVRAGVMLELLAHSSSNDRVIQEVAD